MKIADALAILLRGGKLAVITDHALFRHIDGLFRAGVFEGEKLRLRPREATRTDFRQLRDRLIAQRVLEPDNDFPSGVLKIVGAPDADAESVCCVVDPFCYVSHLSAMQRHGLTDRTPVALSLTTPTSARWNELRDATVASEAGGASNARRAAMPLLRHGFADTVRGRPVERHETKFPDAPLQLRDSAVRVATIGRTFVDMLAEPSRCGGMGHVLEVWENTASTFVAEICEAVDAWPAPIVKVRAGYLLGELLGLADPAIERWRAFAARGGSRKLDPGKPFDPRHSPAWMLSLNV